MGQRRSVSFTRVGCPGELNVILEILLSRSEGAMHGGCTWSGVELGTICTTNILLNDSD